MSTPPRALVSLLRAAWLLAGTLALIAGILGMHVLTSSHASHAAASSGHAVASADHTVPSADHGAASLGHLAGHTAVAHSAAGHAGHGQAVPASDTPDAAPAACGDTCPGVHESGAPCIPSAPNGTVILYPPQEATAEIPAEPGRGSPAAAYSYSPPSPTPCELSISRT